MPNLSTRIINNRANPDSQIRGSCFLVKDYQRGYRWESSEIIKLLDDLYEFDSSGGATYCLQPIVVKPCSDKENTDTNGRLFTDILNSLKETSDAVACPSTSCWELVDGQQRLTTLLIILDYCNADSKTYEPLPYSIRYCQIRRVDNDFIKEARTTVEKWFKNFEYEESTVVSSIKIKILSSVKIIWYEPDPTESSEIIFKKINVGKIRLTSAELFKAFLINKDNKIDETKKTYKEISYEWDQLEKSLSNDDFWYFISNKKRVDETGIDYILEMYCQQIISRVKNKNLSESDSLYSFMVVSEYVGENKNDEDIYLKVWNSIKLIYSKLNYWFNDHELYHYVGFIIATADKGSTGTVKEIIDLIEKTTGKTKSASREIIKKEVRNRIAKIDLDDISYDSDRSKVFKVLLLFNLLTMIQSKTHAKFSFAEFKDEDNKWDIEHIHSQANDEAIKNLTTPEARAELLNDYKKQFEQLRLPEIDIDEIDSYISRCDLNLSPDDWLNIVHSVVCKFGNCDENGLGNLTLLTATINRSYHNALFPIKRNIIIEKDKGEEFVPVCTKNVFLKMYTETPQPLMWNRDDATGYLNEIKKTFERFMND